jgi:serine protease Do
MDKSDSKNGFANAATKLTLASTLLFGGIGYMAFATPPPNATSTDAAAQGLQQSGQAFAAIAKKISPAVVSLKVEKKVGDGLAGNLPMDEGGNPFNEEMLKRFFGDRVPDSLKQPRQPQSPRHGVMGQGSGFIVSTDGYILTNHHVVGDASKVTVRFHDGRDMSAKVVGSDPQSDVAVIKVEAKNLTTLPLGDSTKTEVGEWVLASGAPFGLTQTLTAGIVSAVGRNSVGINSYENFIQTDAAINPGNSGGPLVNLRGEAIGINTAIFSKTGGSVGLGFAIPIDMAKQVYDQIVDHGSVVRGYVGVRIQALNQDLADHFGLKNSHGVVIGDVQKGTPGEKAGLKQGDVIVELDGKQIDEAATFRNSVAMKAPGSQVKLTVVRDGQRIPLTVTLEKLPENGVIASNKEVQKSSNEWGFAVQPMTSELAKKFGYSVDSGVVITEVAPNSPASNAGLEPGMLIQQINRKKVLTTDEFNDAVRQDKDSKSLLLLVSDGKSAQFVVLKMSE